MSNKTLLLNPLSVRRSMLPLLEMTAECITPRREKEVGRGQRALFHPLGNRFPSLLYIPYKHQIFMPSFGPRGSHWGGGGGGAKWCIRGRKKKICLCGHSELSSEKWNPSVIGNLPATEGYTIVQSYLVSIGRSVSSMSRGGGGGGTTRRRRKATERNKTALASVITI